ncbi:reverse transcriptase [Gossypium australe]|uniref:Reverse transcriptase n=1 Tax=Gossypium australe TaxID=47621 RepID=A0A5B6VMW8_9ROSI|nr:reverse transcriptase [Gossypium australe]
MKSNIQQVKYKCAQTRDDMVELKEDMRNIEGKEHVNAIALRSGKTHVNPSKPMQKKDDKVDTVNEILNDLELEEQMEKVAELEIVQHSEHASKHIPPLSRDETEFVSFLNLFKSININLPILELIDKISKYAKYLKEHKKLKKCEQINIDASYCAIIARKIPPNPQRLGELKNTSITLQLVDRSLERPKGVIEYVLVKVRGFILPIDFVVLDFEEDQDIPILLGRPFFATSRSTIDLKKNELIMKIDGEIKVFKCCHDSQNEELRN